MTLPNLLVLLLLLQLSFLFEAQLRRLLVFLEPFAFLFHNTFLLQSFYVLVLLAYEKKRNDHLNFYLFWLCSLPTYFSQRLY